MDELEIVKRHDWWEKGEGLDLWSIPHFLFGILMALLPPLFDVSVTAAFTFTVILGLLWEVYEKLAKIEETLLNSLFDVLLPIASFSITAYLFSRFSLDVGVAQVTLVVTLIFYISMNTLGWMAYRKRKHGRVL
jgi:hypothetical protein